MGVIHELMPGDIVVSTIRPQGPRYVVKEVEPPQIGLKEDYRTATCTIEGNPDGLYHRWPLGLIKIVSDP